MSIQFLSNFALRAIAVNYALIRNQENVTVGSRGLWQLDGFNVQLHVLVLWAA
jgi:hypothetical protein